MNENDIYKLWKDFRYSLTKDERCKLTNRELFVKFQMELLYLVKKVSEKEQIPK